MSHVTKTSLIHLRCHKIKNITCVSIILVEIYVQFHFLTPSTRVLYHVAKVYLLHVTCNLLHVTCDKLHTRDATKQTRFFVTTTNERPAGHWLVVEL